MAVAESIKQCTKCGESKPFPEFRRSAKTKSGYGATCLACNRLDGKKYYSENKDVVQAKHRAWVEANPEKMREYIRNHQRRWRAADPVGHKAYMAKYRTPEINRQYARDDYHRNKEQRLAEARDWRSRNKPICAEISRIWRETNKEHVRALSRTYKARKKNAVGSHTGDDIKFLLAAQRWKCAMCTISIRDGYHVDHVFPLAKGGSNDKSNLQILCPTCNCRKHDKDPFAFARENGLLL